MSSSDQVFAMLSISSRLLADAANQLRDTGISTPDQHVKAIAHALYGIHETMKTLAEEHQSLRPYLDSESTEKQHINNWREKNLPTAYAMAEKGKIAEGATHILQLANNAKTDAERRIALHELAHLLGLYA